jgi:hypothetical protein
MSNLKKQSKAGREENAKQRVAEFRQYFSDMLFLNGECDGEDLETIARRTRTVHDTLGIDSASASKICAAMCGCLPRNSMQTTISEAGLEDGGGAAEQVEEGVPNPAAAAAGPSSSSSGPVANIVVEWMWGDAGTALTRPLAQKNPLRWRSGGLEAIVAELQSKRSGKEVRRPVDVRVKSEAGQVHSFESPAEAVDWIAQLSQPEPEPEVEPEPVDGTTPVEPEPQPTDDGTTLQSTISVDFMWGGTPELEGKLQVDPEPEPEPEPEPVIWL